VLGACCTFGTEARDFTPTDVAALERLSGQVVDELELYLLD